MNRMTKDELIEYFIEQLGDNEILGQFMSIEQIRKKLQTIIKNVTYNDEKGNCSAHWGIESDGKGIINFDLKKIPSSQEKEHVVHELLHALSTSTKTEPDTGAVIEKCGILYSKKIYFTNENYMCTAKNMAINEGMTDFLSEKITRGWHNGYDSEKSIYKVLATIIGQDIILKKAFGEEVNTSQEPLDIFKEELIAKYGETTGIELNEDFKRVSILSDQKLELDRKNAIYGLNENGKKIHSQTKEEVYDILHSMVKSVLSIQQDLSDKTDMMIELEKMCRFQDVDLSEIRKLISKNVLNELLNNASMDYTQKLNTIKKIKEEDIHFDNEIIDNVLFSIEGFQKLNIEEKLEVYINLQKGQRKTADRINRIYDMYVENGKITEEKIPKKELIRLVLENSSTNSIEKIDQKLNEVRYSKVGEYYSLIIGDRPIDTFDKEGKIIGKKLNYKPRYDAEIDNPWDIKTLSRRFSEEKVEIISKQLQDKFEEFKAISEGECDGGGVTIIGDTIRLHYDDWIEKTETCNYFVEFYNVDENGNLQLIPERRKA